MGLLAEPFVEVSQHRGATGEKGDIPRVDEQIAVRYIDLAMKFMGIR